MALVRMFHYSCDSYDAPAEMSTLECEVETGDEWYSALAKERALHEGWHIGSTWSLCPACWENGIRPKHLTHNTQQKGSIS